MLWYAGAATSISMIRKVPGLAPHAADQVDKLSGNNQERRLVQAVVAKTGPLVARAHHASLPAMRAHSVPVNPYTLAAAASSSLASSAVSRWTRPPEVLELEGLFTEA